VHIAVKKNKKSVCINNLILLEDLMKNVTKNVLLLIGFMCVAGNVHAMQANGNGHANGHAKQAAKTTISELDRAAIRGDVKTVDAELKKMRKPDDAYTQNPFIEMTYSELLNGLIASVNDKLRNPGNVLQADLIAVRVRLTQERDELPGAKKEKANAEALKQQQALRDAEEARNTPAQKNSGKCVVL